MLHSTHYFTSVYSHTHTNENVIAWCQASHPTHLSSVCEMHTAIPRDSGKSENFTLGGVDSSQGGILRWREEKFPRVSTALSTDLWDALYFFKGVFVCAHACVCPQKPEKGMGYWDLLGLELQTVGPKPPVWMLGTERHRSE